MLRSTALIALCLLIFAETSSAHLYQDYDKFTGARHEETGARGFKGENELDGELFFSLVPVRTTYADNTQVYKLKAQWLGPVRSEREHPKAVALILLIDGTQVELAPVHETPPYLLYDFVDINGDVPDMAEFVVSADLITRIAQAESVACALYIYRGRMEGKFERGNSAVFAEFVDKVIESE
jgi:hypothetical protein